MPAKKKSGTADTTERRRKALAAERARRGAALGAVGRKGAEAVMGPGGVLYSAYGNGPVEGKRIRSYRDNPKGKKIGDGVRESTKTSDSLYSPRAKKKSVSSSRRRSR